MTDRTIFDISVILGEESIDYPGDTPYSRRPISTIAETGSYELSELRLSTHSGTHIDSPAHFIPNAKTIEQYAVGDFILSAVVVDIADNESVKPNDFENLDIPPGEAILFRTKNSTTGLCCSGVFSEQFVYLSSEAADLCITKRLGLVGLDYITIEKFGDQTFSAHRKLLSNGILVLEGIHLGHVPAGRYTLFCLPLKMKGAEASPVRAVLMR